MKKSITASDQSLSMNQAFEELEGIVGEFESGEIDLEQGMEKFKKGLELAKFLKIRLKKMENEIIEIKGQYKDIESDSKSFDN